MEKAIRRSREWCFRNVIIYSLICCMVINTSLSTALALDAADVTGSSGVIGTQWGDHTIIDTDHAAIIDWSNFDTISGQSVTFNQFKSGALSDTSGVLNRITSANATQFDGALIGNGRVFVVNPAGVIFGSGSTVNVSQLVASGLKMSNDAFNAALADPANRMEFIGGDGDVKNFGLIEADSVYLIGKNVGSYGAILAPNGLVVMAAGDNVYLGQDGSNVVVEVSDIGDGIPDVKNSSRISAEGGSVVLAASDTFSRAAVNTGIITAGGGSIRFRAARVENRGIIGADSYKGSDAGSVTLSGVEEVVLSGNAPSVTADGGVDSDGGTITLESSEGSINLGTGSIISATGGTTSGDGGYVKIDSEHFSIDPSNNFDVTAQNVGFEPGTLHIDSSNVIIADGANTGALDTIYEQDIEELSDKGMSIVISSEQGITVPDILDGEIKGRYGNIELYGTGLDSSVSFVDTTDTISTTLGDIIIGAGSGGLNIGNLETAADASASNSTPGQIILSTFNRGKITVEDLLIKDGWGHAEINVDSTGELIVNGNVIVGESSPILNIPGGQAAEAMIFLKSGDNMTLNGNITAMAHGLNAGAGEDITKAYVGVFSGTNETWFGNLTINGTLTAKAISSSTGTSNATIEIDSWGSIAWGPQAADPLADGDSAQVHVESRESASDTNVDGDIAQIIVNSQGHAPEVDGVPDYETTHMGTLLEGNVLDNDAHPEGELLEAVISTGPSHAESFTMDLGGYYSYVPEEGYVGEDTFTYVAYSVETGNPTDPILVTITMTNDAPVTKTAMTTTHMGALLEGTITADIFDPEDDVLTAALVTDAEHGTVKVNPDGTYEYTPDAGYVGDDMFKYSVTDGEIGAEPVPGVVAITMTNTLPSPDSDIAATTQEVPVIINVLANDFDTEGDPLRVASVTYTGAGSVKINNDNTVTYTPGKDFIGQDSFSYSATDQLDGASTTTTVVVTVGPTVVLPPAYFMPAGPDLDKTDVEISGCPALTRWAAEEVGISGNRMEIWIANGLASMRGFQPCDASANLQRAAKILADERGIYADAVAQIIDEFGSSAGPISEEMVAHVTNAMAHDSGTRIQYAIADEYFDALSEYVGVLHNDMGFSVEKAAQIVANKYIDPLAGSGSLGVASYVAARLDSVSMFFTVVRLNRGKGASRGKY